jgi:putative FmdB family regulatory protein
MPIYEYECSQCRHRCEIFQKHNDKPLDACPQCGGPVHKLISQTSFVLKGTGWYVTDYARAGKKTKEDKPEKTQNKQDVTETKKEKPKAEASAKS